MIYILSLFSTILIIIIIIQYKEKMGIKYFLDRTNEINDRMINISEELSNFEDINILYKQLLNETIYLIQGAECGSILIYNKEKNCMDYKACFGHDEEALSKVHFKKEELFLYEKTELKAPDIIKNPLLFDKENLEKRNFENLLNSNSLEIKVSLSAPLYINNEFFGLINVDNKTNSDAFNKNDVKLISYICRALEIAIKNVTLMNELNEALRTDKLTSLYNRRYFEEIAENILQYSNLKKEKFSVVMIDLDNFKAVNDTYGHKMGDEVLKYFAEILKKSVRADDLVVRYAGDEFVIFLSNTDKNGSQYIIDRIRESLENCPFKDIKIYFSAGISQYIDNTNLDKLLNIADNNMYIEKREKKKTHDDKICLSA